MELIRLDKFLGTACGLSRTDAKKLVRSGGVTVNGICAKSSDIKVCPESDEITVAGQRATYQRYTYIMLNKPEGYVSATEDAREKTVLDLLPPDMKKDRLFPCGRLDKNTLGLVLLTDNGELGHRLLAPKSHVPKVYAFRSKFPIGEEDRERLEAGVTLDDGYVTKPAKITLDEDRASGRILLVEGKYHQIKRMLDAVGNKITYLERISFGPLWLDGSLLRGEWRYLSEEEIKELENHK